MSSEKRLHVLFVNAGVGADVTVHLSLARHLDRARARVSAVTIVGGEHGPSARTEFETIIDTSVIELDIGGKHSRAAAKLRDRTRAGARLLKLALWCRRHHVDVIHVTERPRQIMVGLVLARLSGAALVVHAHISYYAHDATRLANWRLRAADAVIGVSRFTADTYLKFGKLSEDRVFAVHNAVDARQFAANDTSAGAGARQRLGIPTGAPLIGCVARLMRWKGQDTLLEAFARIRARTPNAHLVLAGVPADSAPDGNGDFRDYLLRRIDQLDLTCSVTLTGFVPKDDMPAFYAALDVLAHPALEEPFGLAVVEAMACLRPVVAVNGGGIPEIVEDGKTGLLVPAADPVALDAAITRMLMDEAFAAQLAAAARQHVGRTFTPQRQAEAVFGIYQCVLARRGHKMRQLEHVGAPAQ
jgi:glycosyltransferase involved in cell wall biosynthesis